MLRKYKKHLVFLAFILSISTSLFLGQSQGLYIYPLLLTLPWALYWSQRPQFRRPFTFAMALVAGLITYLIGILGVYAELWLPAPADFEYWYFLGEYLSLIAAFTLGLFSLNVLVNNTKSLRSFIAKTLSLLVIVGLATGCTYLMQLKQAEQYKGFNNCACVKDYLQQ